jgi:hypothetical protein
MIRCWEFNFEKELLSLNNIIFNIKSPIYEKRLSIEEGEFKDRLSDDNF